MTHFFKPIAMAFCCAILFQWQSVSASQSDSYHAKDTLSWKTSLPFDNEVRTGKLANGFRYFIRKNKEPENRVTLYLAMKAGSILENEKQLGLAHFLEHMNFNGLKHFPKNELVNYLQKVGVSFGHDLNAYTSFDETVYQLPIPSDDPEILKNGLQVVRDWAQDAMLTSEEIDKERGVIMEELRGGLGAGQRMQEQYFPMLLNDSRYAKRLPIGKEDIIMNFPHNEIRSFHKEWYRPDLQAVIIVGDIDVTKMEQEVKRLFSDMRVDKNAPKREVYRIPLLNKNQFKAVTDPEMTSNIIRIFIKHNQEKVKTISDFRQNLLKEIYGHLLNNRLSELRQQATPPFLSASVSIGDFLGGIDAYTASVVAKPAEFELGFKSMVRELERVQKYGFTQTEFDRVIKAFTKENEVNYTERDKKKSDEYVMRYLSYFLEDSPAMSDEQEYQLVKELLPTLTLSEVEKIGKKYYIDTNRDILVLAPESAKASLPTENQVNAWFAQVEAENIAPYQDKVSTLPLLALQPTKGSVVSSKNLATINAKELVLSNGVRVILKQTDFKNDEILISGFSQGGTSLYSDADYFSAAYANGLVMSSGVGQLNAIELRNYLTGKNVSAYPYIDEETEGVSASSDKEGLSTAFELIHGFFTEPRIDDDIFNSIIERNLASIENQENNPQFIFRKEVMKKLYNGNIRRVPAGKENINSISKEKALAIYKDRFADASDFVFVIVGSVSEEEIKPFLEEYLASLPVTNRKETAKDLNIYEPKNGFEQKVYKGQEQKAMALLSYFGDYQFNDLNNLNMLALESILTIKLIERLREDEGGVYGTSASISYSKLPKGRFNAHISIATGPEKYQSMIKSALEEIAKVKKEGPSKTDLEKFKIELTRKLELAVKENDFWVEEIISTYKNKEALINPSETIKNLNKITIKSVKEAANKYLKDSSLFKFILLPDQK